MRSTFDQLAKQKVTGAVIDLRGTADGDLETGIAAARLFVKSGTVGIRAGRKTEKVVTTAGAGDGAVTMPVVLLVSNGTANAAEVFAAALSGNNRAELVGEPTAGIAAKQKLLRLPENFGLWMTYERYMTVDGANPIHERGLRPTVGVEMPVIGFDELPPTTDQAHDAGRRDPEEESLTTSGFVFEDLGFRFWKTKAKTKPAVVKRNPRSYTGRS